MFITFHLGFWYNFFAGFFVGCFKFNQEYKCIDSWFQGKQGCQKECCRGQHEHCRANLSPQKTPTVWRQVESFPMTGSGKIQKFMLRDQFIAGEYEETMP